MDGSTGSASTATASSLDALDTGAADVDHSPLLDNDSPDELQGEAAEDVDAAPVESSKPPAKKTDAQQKPKEPTTADVQDAIEKVSGLRVHKEDAAKLKELLRGAYGAFSDRAELVRTIKAIQSGDEGALEKLGVNLDELSTRRLARKLEEQLQSPEDKAKAEQQTELERLRKENDDLKAKKQQDEITALEAKEIERIDTEWKGALERQGLPPRREHVRRMAEIALDYLRKGVELPVDHVAEMVIEERRFHEAEHQRATFEETSDEEFSAYMQKLSPKARERLRTWFLSQVQRNTAPQKPQQRTQTSQQKPRHGAKQLSPDEFRALMEA